MMSDHIPLDEAVESGVAYLSSAVTLLEAAVPNSSYCHKHLLHEVLIEGGGDRLCRVSRMLTQARYLRSEHEDKVGKRKKLYGDKMYGLVARSLDMAVNYLSLAVRIISGGSA